MMGVYKPVNTLFTMVMVVESGVLLENNFHTTEGYSPENPRKGIRVIPFIDIFLQAYFTI
jgi:hypothetical protein